MEPPQQETPGRTLDQIDRLPFRPVPLELVDRLAEPVPGDPAAGFR